MNPVKKYHNKYFVHCIPKIYNKILEKYGLFIFSPLPGNLTAPVEEPELRKFEFYAISHLVKGKAWYWTPATGKQKYKAGQAVITTPDFFQDYKGDNSYCLEDAICFYGPIADYMFKYGIIENGIMPFGKIRRLLPIMEMSQDPSLSTKLKAHITLQNLLIEIHHNKKSKHDTSHGSKIETLITIIRSNPQKWWRISELAEMCNLSINQFRRVFKSHTGVLPKEYIDKLKLNKAAELLLVSEERLESIAKTFGYRDQFHFSRRFKQIFQISPNEYRQQYKYGIKEERKH